MHVSVRRRRTAIVRVMVATAGIIATVAAIDAPLSSSADERQPGSRACAVDPRANSDDYLRGFACPPPGFEAALGYRPILRRTPAGWRYLKPRWAGGACSGPIGDATALWDFGDACRTHDYGYDLVRMGLGSRPEADRLLFLDMLSSCRDRSPVAGVACRAVARWVRVALDIGESLHMDPAPIADAAHRAAKDEPLGAGYERLLVLLLVIGVLGAQVLKIGWGPTVAKSRAARMEGVTT